MLIKSKIFEKLHNSLVIDYLDIIDESHKHEGHAGHDGSGESHFKVIIVSKDFQNMTRVQIHKKIFTILDDEIKSHIHALSINAKSE